MNSGPQERSRLTHTRLVHAAAEIIDREGYESATVEAISRRAGVTKGAFYFHFDSKESVAEAVVIAAGRPASAIALQALRRGRSPVQAIGDVCKGVATLVAGDVITRAGLSIARSPLATEARLSNLCTDLTFAVCRLLTRAWKSGVIAGHRSISGYGRVTVALFVGHEQAARQSDGYGSLPQWIEESWTLLVPALLASQHQQ